MRLLASTLLLAGCAASQGLPEDLTAELDVPLGASFRNKLASDPGATGVATNPRVQHVLGLTELVVINRRSEAIVCEVWEDDACPSLAGAFEGLDPLAPGAKWRVETDCAILDFACFDADDAGPRALPLRTWTWFVEPLPEDDR